MVLEDRIIRFISNFINLEFSHDQITSADILKNIIPSSLKYMELIVSLENEFHFEFDDKKLDYLTFKHVGELVDYCVKRCSF